MTKPTIMFHNTETNEIVEREMNAEELAQWEADVAYYSAKAELAKAEAEAKAAQKAALLDRLGITEDEAKLLLA
jgi:ribosome-binding ATPase YchF (GTP1/OBG family)